MCRRPLNCSTNSPPLPNPIVSLLLLCAQALHSLGYRVVQDVVYNHTFASGPYSSNSVLDKIVPGYYHRRQEDGEVCHSTCCNSESTHTSHITHDTSYVTCHTSHVTHPCDVLHCTGDSAEASLCSNTPASMQMGVSACLCVHNNSMKVRDAYIQA